MTPSTDAKNSEKISQGEEISHLSKGEKKSSFGPQGREQLTRLEIENTFSERKAIFLRRIPNLGNGTSSEGVEMVSLVL